MKIRPEGFSNADFNSLNEQKRVGNEQTAQTDFASRLEGAANQSSVSETKASPLQSELSNIAKSTDFNNSISSRVAVDQAARAFISSVVSPELKGKINIEDMMSAISDFAQNDPALNQRMMKLLVRMS